MIQTGMEEGILCIIITWVLSSTMYDAMTIWMCVVYIIFLLVHAFCNVSGLSAHGSAVESS